ncbi:MAG: hypothetical protein WCT04_12325 [Planctomycetota bacterium]
MLRISFVLAAIVLMTNALAADIPPNPVKADPGMEVGQWTIEAWGNPGAIETQTSGLMKVLQVLYTGGPKDKSAFKHVTHFGLKPKGKIRLNVYSSDEKPPQVAIAVSTTPAYKWHESKVADLKKGWNALEFDVGSTDWKTEKSAWKYGATIEPLSDIRAMDIIIMNGDKSGVVYVQGWSYDADEAGEKVAGFIKDLQSDDATKRELAEKALVAIGRPALEALQQISDIDRPEVLLRAASAMRQIQATPEEKPTDPTILEALEKQREAQGFDDARRRVEYTLRGIDTERVRLQNLFKDAQTMVGEGRKQLGELKYTDEEKRKDFGDTLNKMEKMLKDIEGLVKIEVTPAKPAEMKK